MKVALEVFREVGFNAASMSQIAARVGGSKATLYNYFSSKEELLLEAMLDGAKNYAEEVLALLKMSGDLPTQLERFVTSLLKVIHSDETIQILRVAISVGGTSDIGRRFYELGTFDVWSKVAGLLSEEAAKGTLRADDPDMMASHLRCLCEAELIRSLLGAGKPITDAQARRRAKCTVDVFLRAYGNVN
ncbi:MAG TPA: TetR/AcrR family transcriptional regulator [Eoetvoesiella sp.]